MSTLFRKQAIDSQKQKLHGDILLSQPISLHISIAIIFTIVISIILFLSYSNYSRKETVRGYLLPSKGIVKIYPNRIGNIDTIHVNENSHVKKNQALVTIVLKRNMTSGYELSEINIEELEKQIELLDIEKKSNHFIFNQKEMELNDQLKILENSTSVAKTQVKLMQQRVKLQIAQQAQHQALYRKQHLSSTEYQAQQEKLLSLKQDLQLLISNKNQIQERVIQATSELVNLPNQIALKNNDIANRRSNLQRQLSEAENNYRYVIRAQESGTVAAIQAIEGEFISTSRPIMSIIPQGASLVAELLLPTRSAGFVTHGDSARLRFDAFPYQRFGFLDASIYRIDKALLREGEADLPITLNEPVYRIRAELDQQTMLAYGDSFPLKSGMLLEADIILDRRSLLDWILDPIYSLNGRVG